MAQKGKIYILISTRKIGTKSLQQNHDGPFVGHHGFDKKVQVVRQTFYWPHLNKDVRKYVP